MPLIIRCKVSEMSNGTRMTGPSDNIGSSLRVSPIAWFHDNKETRVLFDAEKAVQFSRAGQLIEKRAPPRLGDEFTVAVPPCNSATRATTARPSP